MNIVYCFDRNHKDMFWKSSESVLKHNKDVSFYTITEDLHNDLKEFTEKLCGYKHVSKACFLRLLIPKYFPQLERALYLDCDTICNGSLTELYNTDFENNYLIATRGHLYSDIQAKELGLSKYFISGMLLMNIPLMNKENYLKQIKEHWKESLNKAKIFSADETIINWVFKDKIKEINEKFNYCNKRDYGTRAVTNPIITHYCGADKSEFWKQ